MIETIFWVLALYPTAQKWFEWTVKARGTRAYYPMALVMIPLDVLFNLVWGTILFRELPKEFLFTTRVKRHYRAEYETGTHQQLEAIYWAAWLNERDPGHVTR